MRLRVIESENVESEREITNQTIIQIFRLSHSVLDSL